MCLGKFKTKNQKEMFGMLILLLEIQERAQNSTEASQSHIGVLLEQYSGDQDQKHNITTKPLLI